MGELHKTMKFILKKTYYPFPVYEWNLPAGHSCPFAKECLVRVDRKTGKQDIIGKGYRCYASASERFPAVREARWKNLDGLLNGEKIVIPSNATHVRIHGSGDFYSQSYFDYWLDICREHPNVNFWAFTKSINYWVNRLDKIPSNLVLTASYGSSQDDLIEKYNLRFAKVYNDINEVPKGMNIDTNDYYAMRNGKSFALLNNFKKQKNKDEKCVVNYEVDENEM